MPELIYRGDIARQVFGGLDLSPFSEFANLPYRAIVPEDGVPIIAQVTVSEDADDDLIITEFPVEHGAVINDHAFKRPAELRLQLGWSAAYTWDYGLISVRAVYERILELQASRIPFQVWTAKRTYNNMLIASLRTHTDAKLEFAFLADIAFKEVVLVNTSVIAIAGAIYDQGKLMDPQGHLQNTPVGGVQALPKVVADQNVPS